MVTNLNGCKVNFGIALEMMDERIREDLAASGYDTPQEFFTAYENAHSAAFGDEWELSKENPIY